MGKKASDSIHSASRAGDVVAVQTIISSNPLSVNSRDKHSRTPFLKHAHCLMTIKRFQMPIHTNLLSLADRANAIDIESKPVVNILCKNKADIGAAAMDDMGAIHFAAQKGHLEVVKTLVSSGVTVKSTNRKGMTPLHYVVQGSYTDLIKYLVKKGANINIKNKAGKSPLDLATTDEIRLLLTRPVETKEKDKDGTESKTEDGQPQAVVEGQTKGSEGDEGKEEDGSNKRKVEDDVTNEASVGTKKAKVALGHLLTSDDTQEEDD